jgi:PIN domain nuclease of toxin-antitoxin system
LSEALLLDTHALLDLAHEAGLPARALAAVKRAEAGDGLLVSSVSAWEIGLLVRKGRLRLAFEPLVWWSTFLDRSGARAVRLSAEVAIASSCLPEPFHGDPADRMLVACARDLGVPLVTRDRLILAYAAQGHLQTIAC